MDEDSNCLRCKSLELLINEKTEEIQKLKQKIQNFEILFCDYENKSELLQCVRSDNSDHSNHKSNNTCNPVSDFVSGDKFKSHIKDGKFLDPYASTEEHTKDIAKAENEHQDNKEYVYDEKLKMYYCISTGFYYEKPKKFVEQPHDRLENDDRESKSSLTTCVLENETRCEASKDWQPPEGSKTTVKDLVREVADQNSGMSDYIYDEKNQMYYCKSTGYFYDPIRKLLYDPNHKIYYLYDQEKLSYDFYCYADSILTPTQKNVPAKDPGKSYVKAKKDKARKQNQSDTRKSCKQQSLNNEEEQLKNNSNTEDDLSSSEEGEIFSTDSEPDTSYQHENVATEEDSSICLPCIRAIVENSHKLKVGTLILITCTGGIMGRDKINAVYVPDISVSKTHAEVKFSNESGKYSIEDLGSQNGTFINEMRLSEPKQKSPPHDLKHGDKLTLGTCKMLLHIHEGYETCDKCEPGQVMAELSSQDKILPVLKTKEEKEKERRKELRQMKKKYGLDGMDYTNEKNAVPDAESGYEDKAKIRRKTVGSENPYEKTEMSSMNEVMSKCNKGYQMLKKLGWKEGESLGTTGSGISEPIPIRPWMNKAGLGSTDAAASTSPVEEDRRKLKWVKAQERYFRLSIRHETST